MPQQTGSLVVCNELQRGLAELGITSTSVLLRAAVPPGLKGQDLIVRGLEGIERSLVYGLAFLQRLRRDGKTPKILIIVPSPSRAREVQKEIATVGRPMAVTCEVAGPQVAAPCDVLIGCPDILLERLDTGELDLAGTSALAVDDLDAIVEAGFLEDLQLICKAVSSRRKTIVLHAHSETEAIAASLVHEPTMIAADRLDASEITASEVTPAEPRSRSRARRPRGRRGSPAAGAEVALRTEVSEPELDLAAPTEGPACVLATHHQYLVVPGEAQRLEALLGFLLSQSSQQTLLFARTRSETKELSSRLREAGIPAGRLNGDMTPSQKSRTIEMFRRGEIRVLAATDAADRDLGAIGHVVHYAVPPTVQHYLRRSKLGSHATTLVAADEQQQFGAIQRACGPEPLGERLPEGARPLARSREQGREGRREAVGDRKLAETNRSSVLTNQLVENLPPLTSTPRRRRGEPADQPARGGFVVSGKRFGELPAGDRVQLSINLGMVNQFAASELADLLSHRLGRQVSIGPVQVEVERTLFYLPAQDAPLVSQALDHALDPSRGLEIRIHHA